MSKMYLRLGQPLQEVVDDFDWPSREKKIINKCGICCSSQYELVCEKDRYGIPIPWKLCKTCGTVYAGERLLLSEQATFYAKWYHKFVSAYWRQGYGRRRYRKEQIKYAAVLMPFFKKHRLLPKGRPTSMAFPYGPLPKLRLLDVGGAIGIIAAKFAKEIGHCEATVLDPCKGDLAEAELNHCRTIRACIETSRLKNQKYDLILHCRSLDHLADPLAFFRKMHKHLRVKGTLFVDYVDIAITLPKRGVPHAFQIDHIHNFSHDVFLCIAARCGFKPVQPEWNNELERGFVFRKVKSAKAGWPSDNVAFIRDKIKRCRDVRPVHRKTDDADSAYQYGPPPEEEKKAEDVQEANQEEAEDVENR